MRAVHPSTLEIVMLSNLKIRTLFFAILSLLSMLVLGLGTINWKSAQIINTEFQNLRSVAVDQASNLRYSQIHSLRAMNRALDVAMIDDYGVRQSTLMSARDFLHRSHESFAIYEREAAKTAFGRTYQAKIQPKYAQYISVVEQLLALAEKGAESSRLANFRAETVVPANNAKRPLYCRDECHTSSQHAFICHTAASVYRAAGFYCWRFNGVFEATCIATAGASKPIL